MAWDASELVTLADDLGKAADVVAAEIRQIIRKGALNIKTQLREEMGASRHFGQAAVSITYDVVTSTADEVIAEIGPDKDKYAGPLGNIAYFGTSRGGGTVPDPSGALEAEGLRTVDYLDKLIRGLL